MASTRSSSKALKNWQDFLNANTNTQGSHQKTTSNAATFLAQKERLSSISRPKKSKPWEQIWKEPFSPSTTLPLNRLCGLKNRKNCAHLRKFTGDLQMRGGNIWKKVLKEVMHRDFQTLSKKQRR